jgi:hypothetical protein
VTLSGPAFPGGAGLLQRTPGRVTAAARSAALFQLATDLPAAVLARMPGIHITVAVAWQRALRRRPGRLRRRVSRRRGLGGHG